MPNIVQGSSTDSLITGKVKSYTYPQGKDLSPKSAISKKIVDHVLLLEFTMLAQRVIIHWG